MAGRRLADLEVLTSRTFAMVKPKDPRREPGAQVYAKASSVTAFAECARQFGSLAATVYVPGVVTSVEYRKINGRNRCYIGAKWYFNNGIKQKTLHIQSVKAGDIPEGFPRSNASSEKTREVLPRVTNPLADVTGLVTNCNSPSTARRADTNATQVQPIVAAVMQTGHKQNVQSSQRIAAAPVRDNFRSVPSCQPIDGRQSGPLPSLIAAQRLQRQQVRFQQCIRQESWDQDAEEELDEAEFRKRLEENRAVFANETLWYEEEVVVPINGALAKRPWSVTTVTGDVIGEGGGNQSRSAFDYFMAMYPRDHLYLVVELTSELLKAKDKPCMSTGELLKFYGILLLVTRFGNFGRLQDLWSQTPSSKYVPAPAFGNTGMSRDRFMDILSCIRFSKQPSQQGELGSVQYRLKMVEDFVESFNAHFATHVTPSELLCVDESISRWYGQGGSWISLGLPMYVDIDRKPENGCEIQNMACGRSGITLHLELVSTAEDEASREYEKECNHGTAVLRRLVTPFAGTNRIVAADSYFASVEAGDKMTAMGLQFVGVFKKATKQYPMAHLSQLQTTERGEWRTMVWKGQDGKQDMFAVMWVDRERRYFISTAGTSQNAPEYIRVRWREVTPGAPQRVTLTIKQPQVADIYYSACAQIDRHNRSRQDDLMLERKVKTQRWWFRGCTSILGIIIVDAWRVYIGHVPKNKQVQQRVFYETLATELIDNTFDTTGLRQRMSTEVENVTPVKVRSGVGTHLTPTCKKRKRADGTATDYALQSNCRVCKKHKTTHMCSTREDSGDSPYNMWICHSTKRPECFTTHLAAVHGW